jgi:hypothetical protein
MSKYIAFYRRKRLGKVSVLETAGYSTKKELAKDMRSVGLKVVCILTEAELEHKNRNGQIVLKPEDDSILMSIIEEEILAGYNSMSILNEVAVTKELEEWQEP